MILKMEDQIWNYGASYEYINTDHIRRIRIMRKRIRIYLNSWNYIYVGRTKNNMEQIKKLDKNIEWVD